MDPRHVFSASLPCDEMENVAAADPWNLRTALDGDAQAWAGLIDEFSATMWSWARNQGLGREDAEDVCQTVWYRLKEKGHRIEDPRRLAGWLATTTRREAQAVSMRRRRGGSDATLDDVGTSLADGSPGPDDRAVVADLHQNLRSAFDSLKERCRELLSLLWADVAYLDISELLSMAVGSIGETRRRCLNELRVGAQLT